MKIVDTHTHIYYEQYQENWENLIKDIQEKMEFIVSIGADYNSSKKSNDLSLKYPFIYATVGYHPVDISSYTKEDYNKILEMAKNNPKIVAIGEIGLDYHWMKDDKETQKAFFKMQLEDAIKLNLPVVIHTREALEDTLKILIESEKSVGILHCYPGSFESYKPLMDRFYIGVGGTLTFKNNKKTKELVKNTPIERIVIETDSPYLTPEPFRGKLNYPQYTIYVAEEIAKIKEMDVIDVINITTENAKKVYNIK